MGYIGKGWKKGVLVAILCLSMLCGSLGTGVNTAKAASKVGINFKTTTLAVGSSATLKISGTKKKATWSSSNESVATVSAKGKVNAKKVGKATITAKVGGKKYTCKVTVKKSVSPEEKVLDIVNQKRQAKGLKALKMDSKLQKAARARAKEIVKKLDHTRPNGKEFYTILKNYGVSYHACAENIAAGQTSAKEVMNGWMHSSGHKANIMNGSYKRLGVGLYKDPKSKYKYYWVELFAD